jgi:hypothetical protein
MMKETSMLRISTQFLLFIIFTGTAYGDDSAVAKFKEIVNQIETSLNASPPLYDVQNYPKSVTGRVIIPNRYRISPFRFDVKRTDSLVTPFIGEIAFDASTQTTSKCGSVSRPSGGLAAASTEEALESAKKEDCWRTEFPEPCAVLFAYGYAETKWMLRQITSKPTGCALLINYALGVSTPGRAQTDLNDNWRSLLSISVRP